MTDARRLALADSHRRAQARLASGTSDDVARFWHLLEPGNLDGSFSRFAAPLIGATQERRAASSALGLRFYDTVRELAGAPGIYDAIGSPFVDVKKITTSIAVTGPVAWRASLARGADPLLAQAAAKGSVARALKRHVLDGGREAIHRTMMGDSSAKGVQRVSDGKPCAFCAMLVSRGAVYKSEATADFRSHDGCGCSAVPFFDLSPAQTAQSDALRALWEQNPNLRDFRRAYGDPGTRRTTPPRPKKPKFVPDETKLARAKALEAEANDAWKNGDRDRATSLRAEASALRKDAYTDPASVPPKPADVKIGARWEGNRVAYEVTTPDGRIHTRTATKPFTHVVVRQNRGANSRYFVNFSTSEKRALAESKVMADTRAYNRVFSIPEPEGTPTLLTPKPKVTAPTVPPGTWGELTKAESIDLVTARIKSTAETRLAFFRKDAARLDRSVAQYQASLDSTAPESLYHNIYASRLSDAKRLRDEARAAITALESGDLDVAVKLAIEKRAGTYRVFTRDGHEVWIRKTGAKKAGVTDDAIEAALAQFDETHSALPEWRRLTTDGKPRRYEIVVDGQAAKAKAGAYTYRGNAVIWMDPKDLAKAAKPMPKTERVPGGHYTFMPSHDAGTYSEWRYNLSHEMGHTVDHYGNEKGSTLLETTYRTAAQMLEPKHEKFDRDAYLSVYGRSKRSEAYAETFAEWVLGDRTNPIVRLYAEAFGWDEPLASYTGVWKSADVTPRLIQKEGHL